MIAVFVNPTSFLLQVKFDTYIKAPLGNKVNQIRKRIINTPARIR